MISDIMTRAPLKMSIFELARTVTSYDEKPDHAAFALDVTRGLEVISEHLRVFKNEKNVMKVPKACQTEFVFAVSRNLAPRSQLPSYT